MTDASKMPALDGLTPIDRLRLYATDPETFSFDIDDAIAAIEIFEGVERRADIAEQLAAALRTIEYASRKDSLSDRERLQSVRIVVCAALSAFDASNGDRQAKEKTNG